MRAPHRPSPFLQLAPRASARLLLAAAAALAACSASSSGGGAPSNKTEPSPAKLAQVAPTDRSLPKKPPALRVPHPSVPALPELPELGKQERGEEPPRDVRLNDEPCKSVWTGAVTAALSCDKSLALGAKEEAGARLLVPRSRLSRSPDRLPKIVDHRHEGTEGPIRNQSDVPACTAFAEAAALDHALARWSGKGQAVSVMQIWSRYHSPSEESSLMTNVTQPIGEERAWPFNEAEASRWVPCEFALTSHRRDCGKRVDETRVKEVEDKAVGEFTKVEYLGKADVTVLEAKIAAGQDVIMAFEVPPAFVPKGKPGSRYVPNYGKSSGASAGHAVVLAGYVNFPHGAYFLAHNSWGTAWGDEGYAWIHLATIRRWAKQLVSVDAEPLERDTVKRPKRVRGTFTCAAGLVPDSIGGRCSEACPDHSPRHDDVCAVSGQCPKDYVNLTGECVLAAPETVGKDPDTGIEWRCGPGGCSYLLPKSEDASCTGGECRMSCPAPDFHVAKMGTELVCVE